MSLAITKGMLSVPEIYEIPEVSTIWTNFANLLEELNLQFEIAEIHPDREEVLLINTDESGASPASSIRELLHELQVRTQRSFVALMNPNSPYILVTIRG